jgi:hypothetical protein
VKKHHLVLNGKRAIEVAIHHLNSVPTNTNVLYEQIIRPFKAPKTYKQLKTIRALCLDLSVNKEEEWTGYSAQWWYRHYKLRAYVPQLEIQALGDGDTELVDLIGKARELIKKSHENGMFNYYKDDDYTLEDFIADNPAFSYADAKKEQLINVIEFMLNDAPKKGIFLEVKDKDSLK